MGTQGSGAELLRDPKTVGELVKATVKGAGSIPVTAKIRLGRSVEERTAVAVAKSAEENGAAAITVHGRTAGDNYGVPCDFDLIGEVVQAFPVPVIANGDIADAESALRAMKESGASGVMVARAGLSRPWIFREIAAAFNGQVIPSAPSLEEQKQQLLHHYQSVLDIHGERQGTVLMRKFASRYLSGVSGARAFRKALTSVSTAQEFKVCMQEFFPKDN